MFVDIGFEKNAFLHFWDAIPAALDSGIEEIDRPEGQAAEKADHRQGYSEHLSGRLRSDRAGHEGPDRDERPARDDQPQLRRALSGVHALSAIAAASRAKSKIRKSANGCAKSCASWIFRKASASLFAPSAKASAPAISCAI